MNKTLSDRLIEIIVDRVLLGLLIGIAALLTNLHMERYKLTEAQRATESAAFVDATVESWDAVHEYEQHLESLDRFQFQSWLQVRFDKESDAEFEAMSTSQREIVSTSLDNAQDILRKSRYVLGDSMFQHFHRYLGFLNMRADARRSAREDASEFIRQNSAEMVEHLDKILSEMRFSPSSARGYAMRRAR